MSGIFFGEETPTGAPTSRAAARPRDLFEEIAVGFEAHRRVGGNINKIDVLTNDEMKKRLARIEAATGARLPNPLRDEFEEVDEEAIYKRWLMVDPRAGSVVAAEEIAAKKRAALEARIETLREKTPDRDFDGGREAFDQGLKARARELEERLGEISLPARLIAGVGASFTDPTNVAASLVGGGGKTVLQAILREAVANVGVEALLTPLDQAQRKSLGLSTGPEQIAGNLAGAALFGGFVGGAGKGVEFAWGRLTRRQTLQIADALPEEAKTPELIAARNEVEQDLVIDEAAGADADAETLALHRETIAELERDLGLGRPVAELRSEPGVASEALPQSSPPVEIDGQPVSAYDDGHAALLKLALRREVGDVVGADGLLPLFRGLVTDEDDKIINNADGLARFADDWLAAIRSGDLDAKSPVLESATARAEYLERASRWREAGAVPPGAEPQVRPSVAGGFASFDPDDIIVDAKRFQFKSGGDESGVTDALKGVKKFDPLKAGVIIVWEDRGGRVFVADGHQRVGLARRLKAEGQAPVLQGHILREVDGVSAEDARTLAAGVNIARGTGTAMDAAKVLKARPDLIDGALNPRAAMVKQATGLMKLGDDASGMVVNGVVREDYGALVGDIIKDPAEQVAVIGVLARQSPANAVEAEALIRQANAAGFTRATQESLFGTDIAAESMLAHRADVLSRAVSQLRKDKRIFSTLEREADEIAAAGNVLAGEANREIAQNAAEIAETVLRTAHLSGPVSDALGRAARRLAETGKRGAAVKSFIDELRQIGPVALRSGALGGLSGRGRGLRGEGGASPVAGSGRPPEAEASGVGPAAKTALDDFDDPRKGAEIQNEDLTDDLFGGPIRDFAAREAEAKKARAAAKGEAPEAPEPAKPDPDEKFLTGIDANGAPIVRTRRELQREFEADEDMIARLEGCVKR